MPWPVTGKVALSVAFNEVGTLELARASCAVYFVGHWASASSDAKLAALSHGATWKFSNYADQIIAARCSVPRHERHAGKGTGPSLKVIEGVLRLCYSTPYSWTWHELGWATESLVKRVRKALVSNPPPQERLTRDRWDSLADEFEILAKSLTERGDGSFANEWDTSRFMMPEGTWIARRDKERQAKRDVTINEKALASAIVSLRLAGGDTDSAERAIEYVFIQFAPSPELKERVLELAGTYGWGGTKS